ncbi:MAG: (d)CMP kinase [Xanthomonadales bacterium]|nr:(d)CMP kinase [Gammaproteobacteria bacterium]NND56291.1 (d)CMP kinase [Xanthomonadales bacterium]NNK52903.1 (d)CMP kinase [Xanthomonadales bacterium]
MPEKQTQAPVVTVDGPGGSGKGTIAMRLAEHLGWHFLDSGALYRLVAVAAMDRGVSADDEETLGRVARSLDANFGISEEGMVVLLDGNYITGRLRSETVSVFSSRIAAFPFVREALIVRQRAFRKPPGLVADGRDMGTVIFPDAKLKIFLTASAEARAERRYKQLKEKGESVNLTRLFQDIKKRDERDSTRAVSPLRPAEDAHVIDSTELSINEVLREIHVLLEKNGIS